MEGLRHGDLRPADPVRAGAVGLSLRHAAARHASAVWEGRAFFNHFPVSPLVTVTWVFHGHLHMVEAEGVRPEPLPRISVSGPQPAPLTSWSPGEILALPQAFEPKAWAARTARASGELTGRAVPLGLAVPPGRFRDAVARVSGPADLSGFEIALAHLALEGGFADPSHRRRAVRRMTGQARAP